MTNVSTGLGKRLDAELAKRWRSADDQIIKILARSWPNGRGAPSSPPHFSASRRETLSAALKNFASLLRTKEYGIFLGAGLTASVIVIAWPVADRVATKKIKKILLGLYVEVHSRLVSWWLTNAWRSEQLARAAWKLGDSEQIVPAAACARSLLETAAAFWVDGRKLSELWRAVKVETAEQGPKLKHWHDLTMLIWLMMWGAKFDNKVPDLAEDLRDGCLEPIYSG